MDREGELTPTPAKDPSRWHSPPQENPQPQAVVELDIDNIDHPTSVSVDYNHIESLKKLEGGYDLDFLDSRKIFVFANPVTHSDMEQDAFTRLVNFDSQDTELADHVIFLRGRRMVAWYGVRTKKGRIAE